MSKEARRKILTRVTTPYCGAKLPVQCKSYDKTVCYYTCPQIEADKPTQLEFDFSNDELEDMCQQQITKDLNGNAERR